jgi:Flp pilus assembly protein TadD
LSDFSSILGAFRKREQAKARSSGVVHRDPEHFLAYFHLGRYSERLGRTGEAVSCHRAAAELSGRAPYLTAFLGLVLVLVGDRNEAEDIANDLERSSFACAEWTRVSRAWKRH